MQYISVSVLTPMGLPEGEDLKRSETIQTSFILVSNLLSTFTTLQITMEFQIKQKTEKR